MLPLSQRGRRQVHGCVQGVRRSGSRKTGHRGQRSLRPLGKSLGVIVCDTDEDGWPDIVVANDTVRNFFFHNKPGPNGRRVFVEDGQFAGVAYA